MRRSSASCEACGERAIDGSYTPLGTSHITHIASDLASVFHKHSIESRITSQLVAATEHCVTLTTETPRV